jgi:hypothetical protein
LAQFFQRRGRGFQMRTRGASSSTSDSTERVLNRSAAVVSVNRRCRLCFGRFATTLDFRLFQQNRSLRGSRLSARRLRVLLVCMPAHPRETTDEGAGNQDDGNDERRGLQRHRLNSYYCSFRRSTSAISSSGNSCGASLRALSSRPIAVCIACKIAFGSTACSPVSS